MLEIVVPQLARWPIGWGAGIIDVTFADWGDFVRMILLQLA